MKNKFILEDIKRIHEIMGSNPKNILIEAILGGASDDFIRTFFKMFVRETPDVADDILNRVVQTNGQAAQKMAAEGITDFTSLLANGSDDLIRTFFKESGALANLSDDFGRILLKLAQEGDGVAAPLVSDIERIVAAGVPDAIEQLKQTLKNAGIADDVVNMIINSAKNAGKIVNVTQEVLRKLLVIQEQFIAQLKKTSIFKSLPKDKQTFLINNWKLETEQSLQRVFGAGGPKSEQAMYQSMIKELEKAAEASASVGLPVSRKLEMGGNITWPKLGKKSAYIGAILVFAKLLKDDTLKDYTEPLGKALKAFWNGFWEDDEDETQTNTTTSTPITGTPDIDDFKNWMLTVKKYSQETVDRMTLTIDGNKIKWEIDGQTGSVQKYSDGNYR